MESEAVLARSTWLFKLDMVSFRGSIFPQATACVCGAVGGFQPGRMLIFSSFTTLSLEMIRGARN